MDNSIFKNNNITSIFVASIKDPFNPNVIFHYGRVEFKRGLTSAKEEFYGESFADVVFKIQKFIDENKP